MGPVKPTPHAARQARNQYMGPCNPTPHAAARSRVCHGPCTPPFAAVSIATPAMLAHFAGLLTLLVFSIFVIGCCMAFPLLLPPPPHCGSTLCFGPVTAQRVKCAGDI
ncbi:unnamed protein product [Staurois parvus]|uniref:Uncharacterized protein n=1 Tax=Staurois parvus TaxID=386267 RepID=A0ABN9F028_9NEOB|nr:unnamed protein product [Staurois parvus]